MQRCFDRFLPHGWNPLVAPNKPQVKLCLLSCSSLPWLENWIGKFFWLTIWQVPSGPLCHACCTTPIRRSRSFFLSHFSDKSVQRGSVSDWTVLRANLRWFRSTQLLSDPCGMCDATRHFRLCTEVSRVLQLFKKMISQNMLTM